METACNVPVVPGAPWAVIAVMGVTGSGKSTFIRTISGDDTVQVGEGLTSCTSDLKGYSFHLQGYNVNLVDSPGFNDTFRSETDVLQDIASWLKDTYEGDTKLNGIVYLHGINHARMEGSALRNLKMFRELCGTDPLKNVILVTTFWGQVDRQLGLAREKELAEDPRFWGGMVKRGSRMARFQGLNSGAEIVASLLGSEQKPLKIQRELVEDDMSLIDTAAGKIVNEELSRLEKVHREEKAKMQQQMDEAMQQRDFEMQEIIREQKARVEDEISRVQRQQTQLKADQRADRRRLQMEFDNQLYEQEARSLKLERMLTDNNRERERERAEQDRRIRELEAYNKEATQRWRDLDIDQIVAKIRAQESKLRPDEREMVEAQIQKHKCMAIDESPRSHGRWKSSAKLAGEGFLQGMRLALPLSTALGLGLPSMFGDNQFN